MVREFLAAWWGTNLDESVFGYDAGRAHLTWGGPAPTDVWLLKAPSPKGAKQRCELLADALHERKRHVSDPVSQRWSR